MPGGYMGKVLFVNLSKGKIKTESLEEKMCRDFIGGYGLGARILYSRQQAKVKALAGENILGFLTGPLTGTPAPTGARYVVVAKSPLTGTWGDANSGGEFGPYLKFAGCDAVFFTSISEKPIYLLIDNGKAELKDAAHLWGKDTYETEDILEDEYGAESRVSCIGPSGEKLSLISCIINRRGCAAGRSGLGAVMGSKKLKAVVARGNQPVAVADKQAVDSLREKYMAKLGPIRGTLHKYGTASHAAISAQNGDSPVKNWGGIGVVDFPDVSGLEPEAVVANLDKHIGCWHCPIACEAYLKEGTSEYRYAAGSRRPEYETLASFGAMCLNNNTESIAKANDICNRYGIDTISAGCTIAFAIECYENGLITKKDTGGIELAWGNHRAIVDMTENMARREGFGNVLADGVKLAAERIGRGADKYAVHIGGQELGMHDPKLMPPMVGDVESASARYQMAATPGRHTQGFGPSSFMAHALSSAGLCYFGGMWGQLKDFLNAVTGFDYSRDELSKAGDRIATLRHAFNLREGINPLQWTVHPRIIGQPPQESGPLAGVTADLTGQIDDNLAALDWDRATTVPSQKKLKYLSLDDVAGDLWP